MDSSHRISSHAAAPPRVAPLDPPYATDVGEDLAAMMPPGMPPIRLFRTLAHNPRVLKKVRLGNLLDRGSIDRREREIVILRTTARCRAEYEWGVHVTVFASRVGLTPDQVAATVRGSAEDPAWSERDRSLVRLVDELHDTATISDRLWADLVASWTAEQLIELVALAGFYHLISFVTNGFGVELEEMGASFPA